jgi:starch phosphorylase
MDSATLKILLQQGIVDNYQTESPDIWLSNGNPWEIKRDISFTVSFGGVVTKEGKKSTWVPAESVSDDSAPLPVPDPHYTF